MQSKHHVVWKYVYCMVLFNRRHCCCCTSEGLHEGLQKPRAAVNIVGRWAGPKLLIGIILTSCNYSPEIHSYCRGFNEQAITQPTIIITRTIKHDGYSLVKCSHMWRPHILLRTLADRRTQTWAHTTEVKERQRDWQTGVTEAAYRNTGRDTQQDNSTDGQSSLLSAKRRLGRTTYLVFFGF